MNIVVVGGGTAGWLAALFLSKYRPGEHNVTVIETSTIPVVGVGESTTGVFTDILTNHLWDFGCDHDEFIVETGATLKYAIKHSGWTKDITQSYIAPLDGTATTSSTPDAMLAWGLNNLSKDEFIKLSRLGYWINNGLSNFDIDNQKFEDISHAMHVDAHLVGKYFKKICLKSDFVQHIDSKITNVNFNDNGFIRSVGLVDGSTVEGDFFIDCTGFSRLLMSKMEGSSWVSFKKHLPINTGMPFLLKYKEGEMPKPYTHAWAQKAGWMWQIPLMDRIGCGYVFCDSFSTPEQAQADIEESLGQEIDPIKIIKFDSGRQENAWVKNCVTIGLAASFLEPLEATSIHGTIVTLKNFVFEYLKPTLEQTINTGSMNVYNARCAKLHDEFKDFVNAHYMGGRNDTEFWKYISTGVTKTDYVADRLEMLKSRLPTIRDFPDYWGAAGWPLWAWVLDGIGHIDPKIALNEINMQIPGQYNSLNNISAEFYYNSQDQFRQSSSRLASYDEFIEYFRKIREQNGIHRN
jgi:tryptophan halogenase